MRGRCFGRGELLLIVLWMVERGAMSAVEVTHELGALLGDEYRFGRRDVLVALDALAVEGLVEVETSAGAVRHRLTAPGRDALRRREGAPVLRLVERSRGAGSAMEDVAILFTDIVGSTELLERLGDDAAHEIRRGHFAQLREAVRAHRGREVKSLGDGLMVAFESVADAVACALAMQHAVAAAGDPIELRVGLAWGQTVREDGDHFGRTVVVARRLCDAAGGGEVLVSESACELLDGALGEARLQPRGPLALKGLSAPVAASALGRPALVAVA